MKPRLLFYRFLRRAAERGWGPPDFERRFIAAASKGRAGAIRDMAAAFPEAVNHPVTRADAMRAAAANGRAGALAALIDAGADANDGCTRDTFYPRPDRPVAAHPFPPLAAAAEKGQLHAAEILLRAGADPNAVEGRAFLSAVQKGHAGIVAAMLRAPKPPSPELRARALSEAAAQSHGAIVSLLIETGADMHAGNENALQEAVSAGNNKVVKMLLRAGADVHAANDAALFNAQKFSTVRLLVNAGADPLILTRHMSPRGAQLWPPFVRLLRILRIFR